MRGSIRQRRFPWRSLIFVALPAALALWASTRASEAARVDHSLRLGDGNLAAAPALGPAAAQRLVAGYGSLPLGFEPNRGQADPRVRFLARGEGYTLFLAEGEAVFSLPTRRSGGAENGLARRAHGELPGLNRLSQLNAAAEAESLAALRLQMIGAKPGPEIVGLTPLEGRSHYLVGADRSQWVANVPSFARVRYRNVYPGVSLDFYGVQRQIEFDFVVAPGASPDRISLRVSGAREVRRHDSGGLVLTSAGGDLLLHKPLAYQEGPSGRRVVEASFAVSRDEVRFLLGDYDHRRELIIDPAMSYSTYLGGNINDLAMDVAVDAGGNAYITGRCSSPTFPGTTATLKGSYDAFVTKLNPSGGGPVFTTYIGGSDSDTGFGVAVDSSGAAYVVGTTVSKDLPVGAMAPQFSYGGGAQDAFVAKLDPSGATLAYVTYLGGSDQDVGYAVAVDSQGNATAVGVTASLNFPTSVNAYDRSCGTDGSCNAGTSTPQGDGFITKLNAAGTAITYSTFFGGSSNDYVASVALDAAGNTYVTGATTSADLFVSSGAVQSKCGTDGLCNNSSSGALSDTFVTKFAPGGAAVYSTFLGASRQDAGAWVVVDASGQAVVVGSTLSPDFPTTSGAFDRNCGNDGNCTGGASYDVFVTKLNADATALVFSTYLGGSGSDTGSVVALDSTGKILVTGATTSNDFPTADPLRNTNAGGADAFVSQLTGDGSALIFSTYLGGSSNENSAGAVGSVAADSAGGCYVVGDTSSNDFPTQSAVQSAFGGGTCTSNNVSVPCADGFVTKLALGVSSKPDFAVSVSPSGASLTAGQSVNILVTVAAFNGAFASPVTLSCEGLQSTSSCQFSPGSVTPGSGQVTSTLTVVAAKSAALLVPPRGQGQRPWLAAGALAPALVALVGGVFALARRRRRTWALFCLLVCTLATGAMFTSGCNSSSSTDTTASSLQTITVRGTASSGTHTTTVTLAVQ